MGEEKYKYIDVSTGEIYHNAGDALYHQNKIKEEERQDRESRKNPPFIQLTKDITPEILSNIGGESGAAIQVLMFFFKNMDDYNVLMVSQQLIADTLDINQRTVARAIKVLEKHGAIGIGKVSNTNVYIINPRMAWQKANRQRGTVILKGNIILGKEENEELFKKFNDINVGKSLEVKSLATKIVKNTRETSQDSSSLIPSSESKDNYENITSEPLEANMDDLEDICYQDII